MILIAPVVIILIMIVLIMPTAIVRMSLGRPGWWLPAPVWMTDCVGLIWSIGFDGSHSSCDRFASKILCLSDFAAAWSLGDKAGILAMSLVRALDLSMALKDGILCRTAFALELGKCPLVSKGF